MGAVDHGGDCLPEGLRRRAEAVLGKAAKRLAFVGAHTVVALAGATGSGKSSLFNRLVGDDIAIVGELRPTTSKISAAVWGNDGADQLLDWLGAAHRHHVHLGRRARLDEELNHDGLILLDLPDIDSDVAAHRAEADRVLELADVFVWVTDPQKYADSVLHDEYLAAARHHQTVTLVVLNQADRMRSDLARVCHDDLKRLLRDDGLPDAEVFLTSARTGLGLAELAEALARAATAATAARTRLLGDIRLAADELRPFVADTDPQMPADVDVQLVSGLARSAGLPTVLDSVERDYRRQARRRTGWLFGRWVQQLRPDPLVQLGLASDARRLVRRRSDEAERDDVPALLRRSSVPQAAPAARAAVELGLRRIVDATSQGLPHLWAQAVDEVAFADRSRLPDALDQAILATPIPTRRPIWWSVVNVLQWVSALAIVLGAIATGTLVALRLPVPDEWRVGFVPIPMLVLVGGAVLGIVLALLAGPLVRVGARRRRALVERQLIEQIADVARQHLLAPVRAVIERHAATRAALEAACGR